MDPNAAKFHQLHAQKPVILIAEDEEITRFTMTSFLNEAGYHVIEVPSADDALAMIDSTAIDLVFTDINMPGELKGDALAEWLSKRHPELPVILTSGAMKKPLSCNGGNHRRFIAKPYVLVDVEQQIRELLG
jgi:CheY-like chemotaxis protein